jgi:hypothetical protein
MARGSLLAVSRIAVKWTFLLSITLLCASLIAGCGASSNAGQIDVPGLQHELETVIHLEKLVQGFDFTVKATCLPSPSGDLQFACRVDATTPNRPTLSWTVMVTCHPPGTESAQRCVSDTGEALQ